MTQELQHYGVPGMKWGVRKRQVKAAKYKKLSNEARSKGKHNKADRLYSKSRSYVQGSPEYQKRMSRNLSLVVAAYVAAPSIASIAASSLTDQQIRKTAEFITKAEKARLSFVLRNDVRMPRNRQSGPTNALTTGKDYIKRRFGSYKITSL